MAKIIIADDSVEILNMVSEYLKMQSFVDIVKSFTSGKELLKHLENESCDVLLLDICMPEIDGVELLSQINNNPKYHRPKKIAMFTAFLNSGKLNAGFFPNGSVTNSDKLSAPSRQLPPAGNGSSAQL